MQPKENKLTVLIADANQYNRQFVGVFFDKGKISREIFKKQLSRF